MRNDKYYVNLECKHTKKDLEREQLEIAIKEYLANGGSIRQIATGVSTLRAITEHETHRKIEREKNFGDK